MTEWARLANTAGPAWALVLMIGGSIVAFGAFMVRRLFGEESGLVTVRMREQSQFEQDLVKELKEHNATQLLKCDQHGKTLAQIQGQACTLQNSDHAMLEAAIAYMRATDCLQNGEKKRVEELLIAAKGRLESERGRHDG